MKTIRYKEMVTGSHNQIASIEISNYGDCLECSTYRLSEIMKNKANAWIIDGEPFHQISALYELLKYLRKEKIFIHIKSRDYDYGILRGTSVTDEILDMCDVFTGKDGRTIDLRIGNGIFYLEVDDE